MIDIETRKIIDMIESREREDVKAWLSSFKNIVLVSRDGSRTFRNAIKAAHKNCLQVSDRFHMVKNLVRVLKSHLRKTTPGRILIPMTNQTKALKYQFFFLASKREKILIVKDLYKGGKTISEICDFAKLAPKTIKQYIGTKQYDLPKENQTVREKLHIETTNKKIELKKQINELITKGDNKTQISLKLGVPYSRISKLTKDNYNPIHGQYGVSRKSPLKKYYSEILEKRLEGMSYKQIHEIISSKGYKGTIASLRVFMSKERRVMNDYLKDNKTIAETIERKWIEQLLYPDALKSYKITNEQYEKIISHHPDIKTILEINNSFKKVFKKKDKYCLFEWLSKTKSYNIPEVNSVISGIESDLDAVINAVELDYNNGLAEGKVNKIKMIKRIMFGRNSFELLRKKVLF